MNNNYKQLTSCYFKVYGNGVNTLRTINTIKEFFPIEYVFTCLARLDRSGLDKRSFTRINNPYKLTLYVK